mmetsp:Transcript_60542/g.88663  ORF Transcript_60542/g.88663 Transcript_60542/m.88663 type:complete len:321 (-) Transcript_60542:100-1062(-)
MVVTASRDKTIKSWNISTCECLLTLRGHSASVTSVAWSPNCKNIASGSWDNTIRVWNSQSGLCESTLRPRSFSNAGFQPRVDFVAWSADGTMLASGSDVRTVKIWSLNSTGNFECHSTLNGHWDEICSVVWSADRSMLASVSIYRTIKIWSLDSTGTFKCNSTLEEHSDDVSNVAISLTDLNLIVNGLWDNTIKSWNVSSGECLPSLKDRWSRGAVTQVELSNAAAGSNSQKGEIKGQTFSFKRTGDHRQILGKYILTMKGDLVLIHTIDDLETQNKGGAVAFFRVPSSIETMECVGCNIAVSCQGGEVLLLRAPLLAPS